MWVRSVGGNIIVPKCQVSQVWENSVRSYSTRVNWKNWRPEVFAEAKRQNKPIFVSSSSESQWCKLMGKEAFADASNAEKLNSKYVPIKIQKDEERGIDKALMMFLQLKANGQGGWPLNVVLTPTKNEPFIAASYLSAGDFGKFLDAGAEAWASKSELCEKVGSDTTAELIGIRDGSHGHEDQIDVRDAIEQAGLQYKSLSTQSPRFVMGYALSVLGDGLCSSVLSEMAPAGIVDHLNGGVFAYSISSDWHFPNFQKTLSGQATLLMACAAHLSASKADATADAKADTVLDMANGVVRYIGQLVPHTAEECSKACSWTYSEFEAALASKLSLVDRDIAQMYWGVNENGNINPDLDPLNHAFGQNVLSIHKSNNEVAAAFGVTEKKVQEVVKESKALLQEYQKTHKPSEIDARTIFSDLGLALAGLAQVSKYVPDAAVLAEKLASKLASPQQLSGVSNTCDDYAFTIMGLLDYYKYVNPEKAWIDAAYEWQLAQNKHFADEKGGYFYSQSIPNLYFRPKFTWDGADPNYNGVSARNCARLSKLGYPDLASDAQKTRSIGIHGILSSPLAHLSFVHSS